MGKNNFKTNRRIYSWTTAPPGEEWVTGAIVSGGDDTAEAKINKLKDSGISVAESVAEIGQVMKSVM